MSDASWKMSPTSGTGWTKSDFDTTSWSGKLKSSGKLGVSPWGVPTVRRGGSGGQVTSTEEIAVADGFVVDHIYTVPRDEQGSWVSLTVAPDGRLIACDQGDKGAYFVTVTESKAGTSARVEPIEVTAPGSSNRLSGAAGIVVGIRRAVVSSQWRALVPNHGLGFGWEARYGGATSQSTWWR